MEDKEKSIFSLHFFQRGEIFKIKSIDAFVKPELYKLEDLLGTEIKGNFYAKQLRLAPNGDDPDFVFEVEAILKTRKVRGVEQILVKYLYYPGKNITFETLLSKSDYVTFFHPPFVLFQINSISGFQRASSLLTIPPMTKNVHCSLYNYSKSNKNNIS